MDVIALHRFLKCFTGAINDRLPGLCQQSSGDPSRFRVPHGRLDRCSVATLDRRLKLFPLADDGFCLLHDGHLETLPQRSCQRVLQCTLILSPDGCFEGCTDLHHSPGLGNEVLGHGVLLLDAVEHCPQGLDVGVANRREKLLLLPRGLFPPFLLNHLLHKHLPGLIDQSSREALVQGSAHGFLNGFDVFAAQRLLQDLDGIQNVARLLLQSYGSTLIFHLRQGARQQRWVLRFDGVVQIKGHVELYFGLAHQCLRQEKLSGKPDRGAHRVDVAVFHGLLELDPVILKSPQSHPGLLNHRGANIEIPIFQFVDGLLQTTEVSAIKALLQSRQTLDKQIPFQIAPALPSCLCPSAVRLCPQGMPDAFFRRLPGTSCIARDIDWLSFVGGATA
mmetsp:Transcript_137960/g.344420  ORF Transcript_137960/g.344420 Transcript_137960/m.344420 type:complete len:391 (-) Transcript_137960:972-2144(-)